MREPRIARRPSVPWRRRRGPLAAVCAVVVAAGTGGLAAAVPAVATVATHSAAWVGGSSPRPARAADPRLTTDTPAGCNRAAGPGVVRCFAVVRTPADHVITADTSGPPASALTPADLQSAYGLPSATAGAGRTVAVVDAFDDPDAASDLAVFRSQYGLPPCTTASGCFEKVNQEGQQKNYPPPSPASDDWSLEESLDLDAVSSACPHCHILLVEADNDSSLIDIGTAVDTAVKLGAVAVSNSYGDYGQSGEEPSETSLDKYYNHPGVAITASAGDAAYGVNYPSASRYVTAVGGTTLTKDTSVARGWEESVWYNPIHYPSPVGTGSGCSAYEPRPSWQDGVTSDCARRATADVSADADPASGLAVYDTFNGNDGWVQVGGTSLSSPLIAATYALAGKPAAGTYPSSYLYAHYLARPSVFNDVTTGSNGDCGNVLCTAGKGWDGPTGLGTPHGVSGFTFTKTGSITGTVTDAATGQPVAGARVSVPRLKLATGSNGSYSLAGLPPGSYRVTVSDYGYQTLAVTVTVTGGQITTRRIQLTPDPHQTVSGTVTAGGGTAWPLYAKVSWTDGQGHTGAVYTSPATGRYRLSLLAASSYQLTVTPLYGGYQVPATATVAIGAASLTRNFTAKVATVACTAIGYHPVLSGTTQQFSATSAPAGWKVTNVDLGYPGYSGKPGWVFNNPGKRANRTGGSGNFAIVDSEHDGARHYQDTYLTSPAINLSADQSPAVQFATDLTGATNSTATVDVSVNGGATWRRAWTSAGAAGQPGPATIVVALPQAAGRPDVKVRFGYTGEQSGYWEIDNVFIGNRACDQQAGGLVVGRVASSSGNAINGAGVSSVSNPAEKTMTVATPGDGSVNGGLYELFVTGSGRQQFSASATGYGSATRTGTITVGRVTVLSFALAASGTG
jgi:hypothetical protein